MVDNLLVSWLIYKKIIIIPDCVVYGLGTFLPLVNTILTGLTM